MAGIGGLSRYFSSVVNKGKEKMEDDMGELREEDIWYQEKDGEGSSNLIKKPNYSVCSTLSTPFAWATIPTATRIIPSANSGGYCQEPTSTKVVSVPHPHHSSAPMHIPDWAKILQIKPKNELWDDECDSKEALASLKHANFFDVVELDDDDDEFLPPHEILANRYVVNRCICHSMCEGMGRTLKGRDLTNLRNTILRKIGFIEIE